MPTSLRSIKSINWIWSARPPRVFDGERFQMGELGAPSAMDLSALPEPTGRVRVKFVTPTELKTERRLAHRPEFAILFGRLRDRISTLRAFYGLGPLDIDFRAMGDRAAAVRMTRCGWPLL